MDDREIKGLADKFIQHLQQLEQGELQTADALSELFAEEAQLTNSIIESDGAKTQRQGREEIAQFWREYRESFRTIRSEFMDVTSSDHSAGLFWTSDGSDTEGHPLRYEGVSLLTFDDAGKIARFKAYFDRMQMH